MGKTITNVDKKTKKNSNQFKNKIILAVMIAVLLVVFAMYLIIASYYKEHFYKNTIVNGVNISHMTVKDAEVKLNDYMKEYKLRIEGRNDIKDVITGDDIDLNVVLEDKMNQLMENQQAYQWLSKLNKTKKVNLDVDFSYNVSLLDEKISKLNVLKEENNIPPVDAHISEYQADGYTIVPEENGSVVIESVLNEAIKNAIDRLDTTISLDVIKAYDTPEVVASDERLTKAVEVMNKLTTANIRYEFGDKVEVVDGTKLSEWILLDDDFNATLDEQKVKEYVDYIGKTYNTFGKERTFKTSYGDVLNISGGDYGWWLNRGQEVKELTDLIVKGETVVKEPSYFQTATSYGDDDIGNTYVELNLTAQHLFFYKDGKLMLETDFVSGNLLKDYGTPTGTYPIQYKERNATLKGEDYATPVDYWIPFNKNIGFHDASWRTDFGKDIYKTRGSHGCINMPPAAAKTLYENIQRGVAVIVYELPGTESTNTKENSKEKTDDKTKDIDTNTTTSGNTL